MDIYVEIGIDFGSTQHHHIQIGRRRALGVWAGILCRRNLHMFRVLPDGFHCFQVKALHVLNRSKASGFQHSDDIARDAAQRKAALDVLAQHDLLEVFCNGQRSAAGTSLKGEAIFQQTGSIDGLCGEVGNLEGNRVFRHTGRARHDAQRVADSRNIYHIVHIILSDGGVRQRIVHQVVGDDHHFFCLHGVCKGVAQRAAGRRAVLARAVAHRI